MGMGVASVLLTSCDKAAEQNYTAAPPVATPPAYFSIDYDSEVILEEGQEKFEITVYRANGGAEQTTPVDIVMTTNAPGADGLFMLPGNTPLNVNQKTSVNVTFPEGADVTTLTVTYPWEKMEQLPGIEFNFDLALAGEDTEYFLTKTDYNVMYVPWLGVQDDEGNTVCYFLDDLVYSGWRLTGYPTPFKYEVEIQYNPIALEKGEYILRVNTPYANLGHFGSSDGFRFDGYDEEGEIIPNVMYINATDAHNIYLCDKSGKPFSGIYNTYYVISDEYGNVGYVDRCSAYMNDELIEWGGSRYRNSEGNAALNGHFDETGKKIIFPDSHFFVLMLGEGSALTTGQPLEIWLPGAKEVAEWEELGMANYTDGVGAFLEGIDDGTITYEVPILQNIKNPNLYRLVNPYTTYWPDGNDVEGDYNIDIDVTNPNLVEVDRQESGLLLPYGRNYYDNFLVNAGVLYQYYMQEGSEMTANQIIAEGLNDTFADNVINIQHMAVWFYEDDKTVEVVFPWESGSEGCKVVLPTAAGAPSYASAAVRNKGKYVPYQQKAVKRAMVVDHLRVK